MGIVVSVRKQNFQSLREKGYFIKFWVLKVKNIQGELVYEKIHLSFI